MSDVNGTVDVYTLAHATARTFVNRFITLTSGTSYARGKWMRELVAAGIPEDKARDLAVRLDLFYDDFRRAVEAARRSN